MLDLLYGQAVRARRRWYERHPEARRQLANPVISIGNLTVGGAGKTPLVAAVCRWLLSEGERPAILSRGYARNNRRDGVVVVSDGTRIHVDVNDAGDEPLMLAHALPGARVVVAEDRHLGGVIAERKLDATVHVLDDGFQHVQLTRDLDVLIATAGEISSGRVMPLGRLREPADAAARAHLVVVVGAEEEQARSEAWALGISQWCTGRRVTTRVPGVDVETPVFAFAGIADTEQFFDGLRNAGWKVVATRTFRDHYRYTASDMAAIAQAMSSAGAHHAVTTEKDAVRLKAINGVPFEWTAVGLMLVVEPFATLTTCIAEALMRARTAHLAPSAPLAPEHLA